jgi:cell wall-associated NlpC family hydrolase
MKYVVYILLLIGWYLSCNKDSAKQIIPAKQPKIQNILKESADTAIFLPASVPIFTQNVTPENIIAFAETLIGIPYRYGAADPAEGFDCSGFITYVFRHFNINVPRSSIDFTNIGQEIFLSNAKPGDLILFTGTDSTIHIVGHMGIVTENADTLRFIHSTSGRKFGVTITKLNKYYQQRFVKVIRIL